MTKSLGQIAYEAWEHQYTGDATGAALSWLTINKRTQECYEAAAQAVKAAVLEWRPIAEATRDRTPILGGNVGAIPEVMYWEAVPEEWRTIPGDHARSPAHYMPIPPDPQPEPRADVAQTEEKQ